MNLNKLFETQAKLDKHIVEEKGLQGKDLLDKKILALQVELGELANEWRVFKFWKVNPIPRTKLEHLCPYCKNGKAQDEFSPFLEENCEQCDGDYILGTSNPLLEEYVDCLHFILSIGCSIDMTDIQIGRAFDKAKNITDMFNKTFEKVADFRYALYAGSSKNVRFNYALLFKRLIALGEMLGFTWQEIEDAYHEKNKENHQRQENGY